MATPLDEHILDLLKKHGKMHSRDILASKPEVSVNTFRKRLTKLKNDGKIDMPKKSIYVLASASASAQTSANDDLKKIVDALRSADDNKKTADMLMNLYDEVLKKYVNWVAKKVDDNIDFEKQLLFIENFKWLTAIGDKLMKRWSLEHIGYDTNTRQAQEDAKAKTEERQKAALEDAPLEEQIVVVGSYDPEAKVLIDCIPSSLEKMTDEETDKITV